MPGRYELEAQVTTKKQVEESFERLHEAVRHVHALRQDLQRVHAEYARLERLTRLAGLISVPDDPHPADED